MKRLERIDVRLTEAEKRAIARQAERHGMPVAVWVRHVLRPLLELEQHEAQPAAAVPRGRR